MAGNIIDILIKAKDMASGAFKDVGNAMKKLGDNTSKVEKGTESFSDSWEMMVTGINQGIHVIQRIGQVIQAAFDYTYAGAQVVQTKKAFASLMDTIDVGTDVLDDWRESVGGTVSDMELMTGFQTLAAGTSKELTKAFSDNNAALLEISKAASALNPHLGDTAFMYESITRGIKRNSPLILDNLGIVVKSGEANEEYAKQLGKTVQQLTAEEQQQALLNAVLKSGGRLVEQLGGSVESATDPWDKFSASAKNALDNLKAVASVFAGPLADNIAEAAESMAVIAEASSGLSNTKVSQWFWDINAVLNPVNRRMSLFNEIVQNIGKKSIPDMIISLMKGNKALSWLADYVQEAFDGVEMFAKMLGGMSAEEVQEWRYQMNLAGLDAGYYADMAEYAGGNTGNLSDQMGIAAQMAEKYDLNLHGAAAGMEDLNRVTLTINDAFEAGFKPIIGLAEEFADIQDEINIKQHDLRALLDIQETGGYFDGVWMSASEVKGKIEEINDEIDTLEQNMIDATNNMVFNMAMAAVDFQTATSDELQALFDFGIATGQFTEESLNLVGKNIESVMGTLETATGEKGAGILAILQAIADFVIPDKHFSITHDEHTTYSWDYIPTTPPEDQASGGFYHTSQPTLYRASEYGQNETAIFIPQHKSIYDVASPQQVASILPGGGAHGGNTYNINLPEGASPEMALRTMEMVRVKTSGR